MPWDDVLDFDVDGMLALADHLFYPTIDDEYVSNEEEDTKEIREIFEYFLPDVVPKIINRCARETSFKVRNTRGYEHLGPGECRFDDAFVQDFTSRLGKGFGDC